MDKKKMIETLFDQKIIKVLRLFINNPTEEYYLREIAKLTKVSPTSIHRILNTMKDLDLLVEERTKHLKTYYLNKKNAAIFIDLLEDKRSALQEFADFIKTVDGVQVVIIHGKEEKNKASLLIVGNLVDEDKIREKIVEVREKYKFNIIHLILTPDQYAQMMSMGLYPGQKTVLFSRNA